MSLYNGVFGFNEMCSRVLTALSLAPADVPRFRDAFFDAEAFELVLYTRTGGGNRQEFAADNTRLREVRGYLRDVDDRFDSTYASFHYAVPDPWKGLFKAAKTSGLGVKVKPNERWLQLLADMKSGTETDDTKRAVEFGDTVIKPQIEAALNAPAGRKPAVRIIET